ncbi:MAG: response regulator transcription factor [Flintibacter sp.]|uniref:response regulator transcription factor n=1 Tax=Flintibacter sp. TaxID=1918624 RepID=UPI0026719227|nr:response regulator transcription factor [Flintibacter sp.]MCI6149397.1 response regulator transcription factor [Flintibacter sp.]MDD7116200.1 response regulator transcription factor [Flintibacter sp.]MDY5038505.1 response regulator transcription factor [Lawsonibacter sp.]
MRILIVEDETRLAETLRQLMEDQRYQADMVGDGADGVDYGLTGQYDLIILDVMLPKVDGFEVARRLRSAHISTPILMLTARDDISDKIGGLDCGADDYMTKPFDSGELMARVRALTRRQGEVLGDVLKVGDLSLECSSRLLRVGERSVRLGFKEFEVMRLLMVNSRAVVSKETLIAKIWGLDSEAEDNNVEVYISFLRKKLAYLGSRIAISTVQKVGYYLEHPGE